MCHPRSTNNPRGMLASRTKTLSHVCRSRLRTALVVLCMCLHLIAHEAMHVEREKTKTPWRFMRTDNSTSSGAELPFDEQLVASVPLYGPISEKAAAFQPQSEYGRLSIQDPDQIRQELEQWYGPGVPVNPQQHDLSRGLEWWSRFADKHGIDYALGFGTAIGQMRHPSACLIPYDQDADLFIGAQGASVLAHLAENSTERHVSYIAGPTRKTWMEYPRILLNPLHQRERQMYNCKGVRVQHLEDSCSFDGPIARIVLASPLDLGDAHQVHIDVFSVGSIDRDPANGCNGEGSVKQDCVEKDPRGAINCRHTPTLTFCEFVPSEAGIQLKPVRDCGCGSIRTKCFSEGDNQKYMALWYGKDFMTPEFTWDERENRFTKRSEWENFLQRRFKRLLQSCLATPIAWVVPGVGMLGLTILSMSRTPHPKM
mmetsp:Transcript_726/g.1373  ORF Transcript_726/g.1373 Transcript_726/m.1373 type:complete len:427 (-) Transcript_726:28-1308(-)